MIRLNDITSQILKHNPKANLDIVEKAYVYTAKIHQGQTRLSGEPYLSHPLEAAYFLAKMKMDVICIAAGFLHDTVEDTDATIEEITSLFGKEVSDIVDGVTKISKIYFATSKQRQAENIRKMILAMSHDIRVILVKLADRLHNMQTLGFQKPEKQYLIAKETLDIYAPLAGRMGINWIKSKLEDLCLYYMEPEAYAQIQSQVSLRSGENAKIIMDAKRLLEKKLEEVGIKASIKGRDKHFYSIYRKMADQNLDVTQVYDILAFRVIVSSIKDCYAALGHIHSMWKQLQGRFKDYISVPKVNMYQSLHTTVFGPFNQRMEIQIRTWEMDKVAEEGIAAHWKYKEGKYPSKNGEEQFAWLRQLLEWQQNLKDPVEFLETVRIDLFPDEVYVFTPKGDVKAFPMGSTPIDFAYSIHSEVGEKCMGARINGKMVSLRHSLTNGDIVEIITSKKQHPNENWLESVKTSKARTKIRQWIKNQERGESISLGKDLLEKELFKSNLAVSDFMRNSELKSVAEQLSIKTAEDLLAQIGFGKISPKQVINRLKPMFGLKEDRPPGIVSKVVGRIIHRKEDHGIKVKGISDILIRFANCCSPLPGEHIVGYITQGRGISIHQDRCKNILHADPERLIEVSWEPLQKESHMAKLRVISSERKGILAELCTAISQKDANITYADVKTTTDQKGITHFSLEVTDFQHLNSIMRTLKKLKNVLIVERI